MKDIEGAQARGGGSAVADERQEVVRPRPGRGLVVPAVIFLVLAIVVSLLGWAVFARQSKDMRAESAEALLAVQKVQSDQVSRWFRDEESDARLLATAPGIAGPLARSVGRRASGRLPRGVRADLRLFRLGHTVDSITVVDAALTTVAGSPAVASSTSSRDRLLAADALRSRRRGVLRPLRGLARRRGDGLRGASARRYAVAVFVLFIGWESCCTFSTRAVVLFPLLQTCVRLPWRSGESVLAMVRGDRVVSVDPLLSGHGRGSACGLRPR